MKYRGNTPTKLLVRKLYVLKYLKYTKVPYDHINQFNNIYFYIISIIANSIIDKFQLQNDTDILWNVETHYQTLNYYNFVCMFELTL